MRLFRPEGRDNRDPLRPPLPAVPSPLPHYLTGWFSAGRLRRGLLWVAFGLAGILLLTYHATWAAVGHPPSFGTRLGADLFAAGSFALLAYLLAPIVERQASNPSRSLWLPVLVGGLGILVASGLVAATGGPAQVDPAGVPADLRSSLQILVISLIEMTIALVVLLSLQALVLFRRSAASARNWRVMSWVVVAAAIVLAGQSPLSDPESFVPHMVLLVLAILLMVVNAFRLSWIVYLPFRQKVYAVGLTFALILLLVLLLATREAVGTIGPFGAEATGTASVDATLSAVFSLPVSRFVTLVFSFGIIYGVTALLALLFHLPTARALQQKSGEMEALQALARLSSDVFDRKRLLNTIAGAPVEAGVAEASWLALIEPERGSLRPHLVAAQGLTPLQVRSMTDSERLAEDALKLGGPLVIPQAPADHRVHARPGDGIGSLVVLPLRVHEQALGVLFAARAIPHGFERDDVAALETFAAQAALSLSSADVFLQRLEHERITRELAIAREVQQRLLPDKMPSTERLTCSALSVPAFEVAGDYYDVLELPEGRVGIIVADVAGKGTPAAFHMAELKGVFQALGRDTVSPADLLIRTNHALANSLYRNAFISAVYTILDERTGKLLVARAGHCPAVLLRADGKASLLRPPGIGIGLDRGPVFASALSEETVDLQPGDTVLLYTDGVVEARGDDGDEFGYERLLATVEAHHHLEPDELRDRIVADVRAFALCRDAEDMLDDDLTLVVLRWSGSTSEPIPDEARDVSVLESIPA